MSNVFSKTVCAKEETALYEVVLYRSFVCHHNLTWQSQECTRGTCPPPTLEDLLQHRALLSSCLGVVTFVTSFVVGHVITELVSIQVRTVLVHGQLQCVKCLLTTYVYHGEWWYYSCNVPGDTSGIRVTNIASEAISEHVIKFSWGSKHPSHPSACILNSIISVTPNSSIFHHAPLLTVRIYA